MDLTTTTQDALTQFLLGNVSYVPQSSYWFSLALSNSPIDDLSFPIDEPDTVAGQTTWNRIEIANNPVNFPFSAGVATNKDALIFDVADVDWPTPVYALVAFDQATGGTPIFYTNFDSSVTIEAGNVFLIAPGAASFKFD
jgi:hypothetical protein